MARSSTGRPRRWVDRGVRRRRRQRGADVDCAVDQAWQVPAVVLAAQDLCPRAPQGELSLGRVLQREPAHGKGGHWQAGAGCKAAPV
eukprot:scaffold1222_cov330-Prasinococcus_capsulatus_cf.AAC.1